MFLANNLNKGGSLGGYQISRSLRFNSADSAYLNRTPASASNRKTWTYSAWVKRSKSGDFRTIFSAATDTSNLTIIRFKDDDKIEVRSATAGSTVFQLVTTQVFRDYSAWYHFVLAVDTTNATGGDRVRLYVNGSEVTVFDTDTNPTQNADSWVNNNILHEIARQANNASNYYQDGYMTEMYLIDGQQLTPSSFGQTDAQTGVWTPIAYSGSYGTNGFYLNFSDNSNTTAATLGKDYSGNGNNWTPNNFSVTAGTGNDSLVDSPTSYGTDTGVGGTVRGNYCTTNPLRIGPDLTLSNGNLDMVATATNNKIVSSTIGMTTGKWYWEATLTASTEILIGVEDGTASLTMWAGSNTNSWSYDSINGQVYYNNSGSAYGASLTTGDVLGIAVDADARKIWFAKNGTWQNSGSPTGGTGAAFTTLPALTFPAFSPYTSGAGCSVNFGQRPFAYTAPSGYKALCTQNLPTPTIGATSTTTADKYFGVSLYTGTSANQSITNSGLFQPDLVWIKVRSQAYSNRLFDVTRGVNNVIYSNLTNAEATEANSLTSFNSNGFSLGVDGTNGVNANTYTYVAWQWKANGSGVSNTAGSITSTVSANTTSGFSVVTYTGTGALATVGHGLGVAPYMVIIKRRDGVADWATWHISIGTQVLFLNLTDTVAGGSAQWNGTVPTSSAFTVNTSSGVNGSGGTYVAYCFAPVSGFSAFGSYTGNGSADGPFVFTGFRPAYLLVKRSDAAYDWWVFDSKRLGYNVTSARLSPDLTDAEYTTGSIVDFTSNGFKIRDASQGWNGSGGTIIYMAFSENPFKYSLAR